MEYSKELLEPIVQRVFTYSDVCRELGLNPHSGNIKTVHRKIDEYNLDVSHFSRRHSYANTNSLRRRLIKEGFKECKCEICGISEWLGNPISLQLHHINGVRTDNRLENLQVLCPNCHSQTDNYGSKNITRCMDA